MPQFHLVDLALLCGGLLQQEQSLRELISTARQTGNGKFARAYFYCPSLMVSLPELISTARQTVMLSLPELTSTARQMGIMVIKLARAHLYCPSNG